MSFELIRFEVIQGGGLRARCMSCFEDQTIYPNIDYGSNSIQSQILVAHTCRNRTDPR